MAEPKTAPAPPVDLRCGAYCLYVSLKALDLPVEDFAALEAKLGQPSRAGYSMLQLAEAARSYGAYVEGVETNLDALSRRRGRFAIDLFITSNWPVLTAMSYRNTAATSAR